MEAKLDIVELMRDNDLISSNTYHFKSYPNSFVGSKLVTLLLPLANGSREEAVKLAQEDLFDTRLAHHVCDDHAFKDEDLFYRLFEDEVDEVRREAEETSRMIENSKTTGRLELRCDSWFSNEAWTNVFGILDTRNNKNFIHLLQDKSCTSPFRSLMVQDCVCFVKECVNCKTGSYCFNLYAYNKEKQKKEMLTLCAKNSKEQMRWLTSLHDAGLDFQKDEDNTSAVDVKSIFELGAKSLCSKEYIEFNKFKGSVCLVVNVASK